MVLLVLFIFVIYGVFHRAVDLAAAFQNAPDLLLAVMQRFQMEAVIVAGVHRIQNGDQTADGIVHRRQEFTVLGGIDAAFQILTAAHIEVGFHAAAQKRLVEELIVSASDILRCGVGDVFLIRLPSHLVAVQERFNLFHKWAGSLLDRVKRIPASYW